MKKEYKSLKLLTFVLVFALVLALTVVSAFSWYDRTMRADEDGYRLVYSQNGRVNNTSGVTVVTYAGTVTDGVVEYSDTPVSGAVDVKAGQAVYFKSVVTDTANSSDTVVSLYLNGLTYNSAMGENIHIGLVSPEKTFKEYKGVVSGNNRTVSTFCLEDNIVVEKQSTIEVEWFIKPSTDYTGTSAITPGTIYIAYN
ncbi:MAG: hypothetical protein IJW04_02010 [Ruminococcus sp.]|nr:hypothetical protein [Ruminococcus sp.]